MNKSQSQITVENLKKGQVLISTAREVKGGKINVEVCEHIEREGQDDSPNLLGIFNKGDEAFKASGPRRGYITGNRDAIESALGIKLPADISSDKSNPTALNILNPKVIVDGVEYAVRLQVSEKTTGDEYDYENLADQAKSNGSMKNRLYFMYNGKPVFSKVNVVLRKPGAKVEHTILAVKQDGQFKPGCGLVTFEELVASMEGATTTTASTKQTATEPRA